MNKAQSRMVTIDGLKAIAVQFIVLHHLSAYGPLADSAQVTAPDLMGWLYDHGRIAVQIFLVIGGYLAARALSPRGEPFSRSLPVTVINRYLRLCLPYTAALLLALVCAVFARRWIPDNEFVPAAPGLGQWLAHLFLIHDLLDYESLSTGVWYVAIDFQLFVLLALLLWMGRVGGRIAGNLEGIGLASVLLLTVASLFWFNRNDNLDNWALYFFGAYGLGAVTYWTGQDQRHSLLCQRLLWVAAVLALLVDFRSRLLLALLTALTLRIAQVLAPRVRWQLPRWVAALAQISYALFLVHFPVYMLVSALFVKYDLLTTPWCGIVGMGLTWLVSVAVAWLLHHWIEKPASQLRIGRTDTLLGASAEHAGSGHCRPSERRDPSVFPARQFF